MRETLRVQIIKEKNGTFCRKTSIEAPQRIVNRKNITRESSKEI